MKEINDMKDSPEQQNKGSRNFRRRLVLRINNTL